MAVSHPIMNRFLFTEEIWACIDTIKTCQTIDGELKSLQLRFKKMRVSDSLASCRDKVKLTKLFFEKGVFFLDNKVTMDYIDFIAQIILKNYIKLSKVLIRRHIFRDRLHKKENKVLIQAIQSKNSYVVDFLLKLPNVIATLPDDNNHILQVAVDSNNVEAVQILLNFISVRSTAHQKNNRALYSAMFHKNDTIVKILMALPDVKKNIYKVFIKVTEFLPFGRLDKIKYCLDLEKFSEVEIRKFSQEASRVGHVLGLEDSYRPSDSVFPMSFEGNYDHHSMEWVIEKLQQSFKTLSNNFLKKRIKIINSAFKMSQRCINEMFDAAYNEIPGHKVHIELFNQYQSGKIVYLLTGWYKHSFSIVLYQQYMVVSNRGEHGSSSLGSIIYRITDDTVLTSTWIKKILNIKQSSDAILQILSTIPVLQVLAIPQKDQKYGTCTYVNKLAVIEPMLLLLKWKMDGKLGNEEALKIIFKHSNRLEYKNMTYFFREHEISRLVDIIKSNRYHVDLIFDLVRAIILQHPGRTNQTEKSLKFEIECARARRLFEALPPILQQKFQEKHQVLYGLIQFKEKKNNLILFDYEKKIGKIKNDPYPLIPQQFKSSLQYAVK